MEHLHAPATADPAFDAEVGIEEPPPAPAAQPWWHRTMNGLGGKIGDGVEGVNGLQDAFAVPHLKFTELESGKISVHADTPPGTRWAYRQLVLEKGFDFRGTRYNPKTVASLTAKGLWEGAKKDVPLAGVLALVENLWTFGTDPSKGATFWERTVKNREFWVSTGGFCHLSGGGVCRGRDCGCSKCGIDRNVRLHCPIMVSRWGNSCGRNVFGF